MPKILRLRNIGDTGLNSDFAPWELPPEAITSGVNFRVFAGQIRTSGGFANLVTQEDDFKPAYLQFVNSPVGLYWLLLGASYVYAYDGVTWHNVSSWGTDPSPLIDGDEFFWTGCTLGRIPIINNPQNVPEWWDQNTGNQFIPLPWDATQDWGQKGVRCRVMRSYKNFLFALNLHESEGEYPDGYRWSHPADINGIPYTWDKNDPSALAGRAQLGGASGAIIDGLTLRDSFVLYSQNAVNILDFTGGDFVFRRRKLTTTFGLFCKNALVEVAGVHLFLSDGDIVQNDGTQIQSIMHNQLRKRLTANANSAFYSRSFAVRNDTLKEVWFCVPEDNNQYPSTAYIYNWRDKSWAIRELPPYLAHGAFGPTVISTAGAYRYDAQVQSEDTLNWDLWTGRWSEQSRRWNDSDPIPPEPPDGDFIWGIGQDGLLYGYGVTHGSLDPDIIQGSTILAVYVDSSSDEVFLYPDSTEMIKGSDIITLLSGGESVVLTWNDTEIRYEASDVAFTLYVVTAVGTEIGLNITVDNAEVPPITPLTASGDILLGVDHDNHKVLMIDPDTNKDDIGTRIERTDLAIEGQDKVNTLTRMYPHIIGTELVRISMGSQDFAGGPVRWKAPVLFDPDTQRKVDIRTTGELHAWRIDSIGTGHWSLSGMDIEYSPAGKR